MSLTADDITKIKEVVLDVYDINKIKDAILDDNFMSKIKTVVLEVIDTTVMPPLNVLNTKVDYLYGEVIALRNDVRELYDLTAGHTRQLDSHEKRISKLEDGILPTSS